MTTWARPGRLPGARSPEPGARSLEPAGGPEWPRRRLPPHPHSYLPQPRAAAVFTRGCGPCAMNAMAGRMRVAVRLLLLLLLLLHRQSTDQCEPFLRRCRNDTVQFFFISKSTARSVFKNKPLRNVCVLLLLQRYRFFLNANDFDINDDVVIRYR